MKQEEKSLEQVRNEHILLVLEHCNWKGCDAVKILGICQRTLYKYLKAMGTSISKKLSENKTYKNRNINAMEEDGMAYPMPTNEQRLRYKDNPKLKKDRFKIGCVGGRY